MLWGLNERGAAAGPVPLAWIYKNARMIQDHSGAEDNNMSRQKTTIFANLDRGGRYMGQTFFDKYLSSHNFIAAASYVPPADIKTAAFDFSKAAVLGRDKLCCTTAFFLLPSCGRYNSLFS